MSSVIDSYNLGDIRVEISKTDNPQKLKVDCNDGNYHSEFTIREYEYQNYKRHMNQRIKNAYDQQYGENS